MQGGCFEMQRNWLSLTWILGSLLWVSVAGGQPLESPSTPTGKAASPPATSSPSFIAASSPSDQVVVTSFSLQINGKTLQYNASAGYLPLKTEDGKTTAKMFFIAYHLSQPGQSVEERPITFSFNGGPGSSSVWLHLGVLGPKRVLMGDQGELLAPPFRLVANDASLLPTSDLVFIDPVSTGYSRPAEAGKPSDFHGVQQDVQSVAEFIRLYLTQHKRWASPKFVIGESYGTTRAAALSLHLADRHGIYLNGVMLVSAVLNFQTVRFDEGNDMPHILYLPSYTATAWYHKKLPNDLQSDLKKALAEAEAFAEGAYATALLKGSKLTRDERRTIAQQVARLTGLSEEYVLQSNLRINNMFFMKELLRGEGKTVGRFDSRLVGADASGVGQSFDFDPSYSTVLGPYAQTLNHYLRHDLKYENDLPYEILTSRVQPWDYSLAQNRYLNVAADLRKAMTKNPHLKLYVGSGYYDLATPYFATDFTLNHLGYRGNLQERIIKAYYPAGHMMYIQLESLQKMGKDLADFVQSASQPVKAR